MLEQLARLSEKHKNNPDFKFTELSKYVRNPELHPGDKRIRSLRDETFKPSNSDFSRKVEEAVKDALDAVFPEERLSRDQCVSKAKERLKGSVWLASGTMPAPKRETAIDAMRERVCDPAFERLTRKFLNSHGFGGLVGKKLSSVCWSRAVRDLPAARFGPEYVLGAKSLEEMKSSAIPFQDFAPCQKRARFLSYDICVNGGIHVLVPQSEVKDTLKRLGAASFSRVPWRGKKVDALLGMTDFEILAAFNSWLDAFRLRHLLAENAKEELGKLRRILKMSMFHTMAASNGIGVLSVQRRLRLPDGQIGLESGGNRIFFG
jgi:hypothetical protein